jgi:hypothetical protein
MEDNMNAMHRRLATAGALLLLSAAFLGARAEDDLDADRPRDTAESTLAMRNHQLVPSSYAASPARPPAPGVSTLDAEEAISGSEPDPESFDRRGLETWWQHFQETLKKAE